MVRSHKRGTLYRGSHRAVSQREWPSVTRLLCSLAAISAHSRVSKARAARPPEGKERRINDHVGRLRPSSSLDFLRRGVNPEEARQKCRKRHNSSQKKPTKLAGLKSVFASRRTLALMHHGAPCVNPLFLARLGLTLSSSSPIAEP